MFQSARRVRLLSVFGVQASAHPADLTDGRLEDCALKACRPYLSVGVLDLHILIIIVMVSLLFRDSNGRCLLCSHVNCRVPLVAVLFIFLEGSIFASAKEIHICNLGISPACL